jgi:hypothetical protein
MTFKKLRLKNFLMILWGIAWWQLPTCSSLFFNLLYRHFDLFLIRLFCYFW